MNIIKALQLLQEKQTVIRSDFTKNQQQYLNNLIKQTGIISLNKQGNGFVYQVINISALQSYLKHLQPLAESELSPDLPQRSRNIGLYKNSKQINAEHEFCYLLLKAVGDNIYWFNHEYRINISEQTHTQGVSSLMIQVSDDWQSQTPLFLVENQNLFDRLDWLPANFNGSVIYYGGNMKKRLLKWLAYKIRASELILFSDYDGVGFSNFLNLYQAVKNQQSCQFYLMPNWQVKLALFGNRKIWQDNNLLFHNAIQSLDKIDALTDEVFDLVIAMQAAGKGLEQEAIWL
ncbi:MAG: hypothetical protein WCK96_19195 [Methylococcales bacterium]